MRWLVLLALAGCLWKPNRVALGDGGGGGDDDGGGSGSDRIDSGTPMFVPHVAATAYWNMDTFGTTMMDDETFALPSQNVAAGDLVLLIGSVDNAPNITDPPGFTRLARNAFGGSETQTYMAYWKIATASEPAFYIGKFPGNHQSGSSSAAGTYVLLTIGLAQMMPKVATDDCDATCSYTTTIQTTSHGVATTANNIVIYAAGGNWTPSNGKSVWTLPTGFANLAELGDHGDDHFQWTDLMVGWETVAAAGAGVSATGMISSDQAGHISMGSPWAIEIAVAPQ